MPSLPVPFSQLFLSQDGVLCRFWPCKKQPVVQSVIPECYVPAVLTLVHDMLIASHPGKECTFTAARNSYFWQKIHMAIDTHVAKCVKCARHNGNVQCPAPILDYPPPDQPWDVVSIDLLQLPASHQGSKYLLVCVDHLSRYVVLAPIKDKSAKSIAHTLITYLSCPYSTPRVLLSNNGAESRNKILEEICKQFSLVSQHPTSNSLVEWANRKILEVLHSAVTCLLDTWEGWLPYVGASINSSMCESTGQSPHFIIFGVDKHLLYDLLVSTHSPVYFVQSQLKVFSDIHRKVRDKLHVTNATMRDHQHK